LILADQLRDQLPELRLLSNCGGGSYKSEFKRADKSGARYAIILGDDEIANGTVSVKDLREGDQETVDQDKLAQFFNK
jgi:histidyl-tRNA synthetase